MTTLFGGGLSARRARSDPGATVVTQRRGIGRFGRFVAIAGFVLTGRLMVACGPVIAGARTRVARVERVREAVAEYDRFFGVVYAMQLAVSECEREKIDAIARLARALGLAEGADLAGCAAATRTTSTDLAARHLALGLDVDVDPGLLAAALDAPTMGATAAPVAVSGVAIASAQWNLPAGFPEEQDAAERQISVEMHVAGGALPPEFEARVTAIRAAIRSAMALKRRMDSIAALAPVVRSIAVSLARTTQQRAAARAAALAPEFRDAIDFLDGLPGRAQAQGQSALQIAVRLQASANSPGTE